MKTKTLASIAAVVFYIYCEVFQANPFAGGGKAPPIAPKQLASRSGPGHEKCGKESERLFAPARLAR